jgi:uncharacterized protein YndB with AHSA1/START domain
MSAMKFQHEVSYAASPDRVFAMLADPAFRARVCEAQGVVSHDIDLTPTATGFTLVNDQVQNTAGLPAIAKKIAGDTTRAVIEESWDGHTGDITITAPGKPTTATGTARLEARGSGTVEILELDVKVKVPVIGGKLENLMADNIRAGMDAEHAVGTAWLGGER